MGEEEIDVTEIDYDKKNLKEIKEKIVSWLKEKVDLFKGFKENNKKALRIFLTVLLKLIEIPIIIALIGGLLIGITWVINQSKVGFIIAAIFCILVALFWIWTIIRMMWLPNYKFVGKLLKIEDEEIDGTEEEEIDEESNGGQNDKT